MEKEEQPLWTLEEDALLKKMGSQKTGLTDNEAQKRLLIYGENRIKNKKNKSTLQIFFSQFTSPLILLLLSTAIFSAFFKDPINTYLIITIILVSGTISFLQEKKAFDAVSELLKLVETTSLVLRDNTIKKLPIHQIVPGDILCVDAGDIIPADAILLEEKDLFVNESSFSGESFATEKKANPVAIDTPILKRANTLFMGSYVISGKAKALVITTGAKTSFGAIAEALKTKEPLTAFEVGIKGFSLFLMKVTLYLISAIFTINLFFDTPFIESFLFALALAIGLTPQLLPTIIAVNLAQGARRMAKSHVIVKKLSSIENFGSMDVLCSDKTGTLTKGVIELYSALGINGKESAKCHRLAFYNAFFQTGYTNTIDAAIVNQKSCDISACQKLDELPYDFERKRISILCEEKDSKVLITKGSFNKISEICKNAETADGRIIAYAQVEQEINGLYEEWSLKGFRIIGLCYKAFDQQKLCRSDEKEMTFLGLLLFFDPPKDDIKEVIFELKKIGVKLVMITGDNPLIASYIAEKVGIESKAVITGDLVASESEVLKNQILSSQVFAEIEPFQKEKILKIFKDAGYIVGYLGDGINDSVAMHTADVGISVDSAADILKDVADIILLKKSLKTLIQGVLEGRRTFANTLKYVFMATSANFGNMFSVAGASLLLPFLPFLPKQILLTNLITDLPEIAIATDNVDIEMVNKPWKWDLKFIKKFMLVFGMISSLFDYLTFFALFAVKASIKEFRTGWLIESILSASLITLVIRTRKPFFESRPSRALVCCVFGACIATLFLPKISFIATPFDLVPLDLQTYVLIFSIIAGYVIAVEIAKNFFYKKVQKTN